jgi:hypothetical protein
MTAAKYLVLLAGAMLATGAVAGGDKDMKSAEQKFDQLDKDQDRSLSQSEASEDETLSATFASIDADGDGELSRTEYTAHLSEGEGQRSSDDPMSSSEE